MDKELCFSGGNTNANLSNIDSKLYVPFVTLTAKENQKLLGKGLKGQCNGLNT